VGKRQLLLEVLLRKLFTHGKENEMELYFDLVRLAKSSGGDRYECGQKGDDLWMVVYVPQLISREGGKVKGTLKVIIDGLE